jgi:hypothetical protein
VLGKAQVASGSAPLTLYVAFSSPIPITAGTQYAIVVSYPTAPQPGGGQGKGNWSGATGNPYPGGEHLAYSGSSWMYVGSGYDLHFKTYVCQ